MYYSDFLVDCRFSIINLLVCLGVIEQLKEKYRVDLDEGVYHILCVIIIAVWNMGSHDLLLHSCV